MYELLVMAVFGLIFHIIGPVLIIVAYHEKYVSERASLYLIGLNYLVCAAFIQPFID